MIAEICERQSAAYCESPRSPRARDGRCAPRRDEVEIEVRNAGYLPTYILDSAKKLALGRRACSSRVEASGGCSIDARDARLEVGHLEGWGRGLYAEFISTCRAAAASRGARYRCRCAAAGGCACARRGLRVGEVVKEIVVEP